MSTSVGAAGDLEMAVGLELRGGLVVDHLVGAEDVVAVMDDDVAVEGADVAYARLALGIQLDGYAAGGHGLGLSDGQNLLARDRQGVARLHCPVRRR